MVVLLVCKTIVAYEY